MSAHDAAEIARAELTRAVVVSQQLLDEYGKHAGYRTSAEWLTALTRYSQEANDAAREYLTVTSRRIPPRKLRGSRPAGTRRDG
jgi:hypothetical protein